MKKAIKRAKKSITEKEYRLLMSHTKGDDSLKEFSRQRLLRIFLLLYYSGARINELSQITFRHIQEIIEKGETTIVAFKTTNERILYFTPEAVKEFKKYFPNIEETDPNHLVIASWNKPTTRLHEISLINLVNRYMKKVLGNGYTSHSFRQGILTEMATKGVNTKIMQNFIGHSDPATTLRYVTPTENDIRGALIR